jgi:hypothetical protein
MYYPLNIVACKLPDFGATRGQQAGNRFPKRATLGQKDGSKCPGHKNVHRVTLNDMSVKFQTHTQCFRHTTNFKKEKKKKMSFNL